MNFSNVFAGFNALTGLAGVGMNSFAQLSQQQALQADVLKESGMPSFMKYLLPIAQRNGYTLPYNTLNSSGLSMTELSLMNGLRPPIAPTPPDASNLPEGTTLEEAQASYNQALLTYNQQFQTYQTMLMSRMMQSMLLSQQTSRIGANSTTSNLSGIGSGFSSSSDDISGIL